jgi:6-pyruvoyltetrahydropterin/6-carboxytetrahydropterin synthase
MFRVSKTFKFEAAHAVYAFGTEHKCARVHGHSYHVEVILEAAKLEGDCAIFDVCALAPFKAWLDEVCDHRMLNHALDPLDTTVELLAQHFYIMVKELCPVAAEYLKRVRVYEGESIWGEYEA